MSRPVDPLLQEHGLRAADILTAFRALCQKSCRDDADKQRLLERVRGLERRLAKTDGKKRGGAKSKAGRAS